ncbi:MAG: RDD family protein [Bacteroidota bacterium]
MEKMLPITVDMIAAPNKRFANFVIDSIIFNLLALGISAVGNYLYDVYGTEVLLVGPPAVGNFKYSMLQTLVAIVYYGLFESLTQRTPGKYITSTKVVLRDGKRPENGTILLRTICRQIPFEILSFLGRFGIGWHDTLSKTLVVDSNKYNLAANKQAFNDIGDTNQEQ